MSRVLCAVLSLSLLAGASTALAQDDQPMTNQSVISLTQAKLADKTIILSIQNSKSNFDVSANGLVKLKKSGVSDAVIQAMVGAASGGGAPAPAPALAPTASAGPVQPNGLYSPNVGAPSQLVMIAGGQTMTLTYLTPEIRTAARALGFGGVSQYATLHNPQAATRIKDKQPTFLVAVPDTSQPESYVALASFAVRNNGTREISIGSGVMGFSDSLPKDRLVAVTMELDPNQSRAAAGTKNYRVTPVAAMAAGEYCVFLGGTHGHLFELGVDD